MAVGCDAAWKQKQVNQKTKSLTYERTQKQNENSYLTSPLKKGKNI